MRTFDELEALWSAAPPAPREAGTVRGLCVRHPDGIHEAPEAVHITVEDGVVGDRWAHNWRARDPERTAQVTLINATIADLVGAGRQPLETAGDNLIVDFDISEAHLPAGARLRVGEVVLEVSHVPHTGCSKFAGRFGQDALRWVNWRHWRERRLRGVNTRVVSGGTVRVGDRVERLRLPVPAGAEEVPEPG
ncbi:MAG TPA: MOSC domain-containing protein [candidate division Zixibacteria bacterium]|nr:MOSC domain-containing protein [candidate division Zixibacteria bacterium]